MKRKMQSEVPPLPEDELHPPDDLALPAESPLGPDEASEAVGRARRLLGLLEPMEPASSAEKGTEKDKEPASPGAPIPWPPMRPDEKPS